MGVCGSTCRRKWFRFRLRWQNPNVVNQVREPAHGISETFVPVWGRGQGKREGADFNCFWISEVKHTPVRWGRRLLWQTLIGFVFVFCLMNLLQPFCSTSWQLCSQYESSKVLITSSESSLIVYKVFFLGNFKLQEKELWRSRVLLCSSITGQFDHEDLFK